MSLVVVCGQPCSGKSTVVAKLKSAFQNAGCDVETVDEPSLHLIRNESYKDMVNEKHTRGRLKSAVERVISKKKIVILDSLNNIKGFRYELWCVARSAGTRYCMVHVDTEVEQCRQWNRDREGDKYCEEIFADLAGRFERPDARNRWDAPLFTACPATAPQGAPQESTQEQTSPTCTTSNNARACATPTMQPASITSTSQHTDQAREALHSSNVDTGAGPSQEVSKFAAHLGALDLNHDGGDMPECQAGPMDPLIHPDTDDPLGGSTMEGVVAAVVAAMVDDKGLGARHLAAASLKPSFATSTPTMLSTNTLHEIDQAAQEVINAVNDAQTTAVGGAAGIVRFGPGLPPLQFDQPVTLAELRRHKRAFIKLATKIMFARIQDALTARRMFIDYLRENVAGARHAA